MKLEEKAFTLLSVSNVHFRGFPFQLERVLKNQEQLVIKKFLGHSWQD